MKILGYILFVIIMFLTNVLSQFIQSVKAKLNFTCTESVTIWTILEGNSFRNAAGGESHFNRNDKCYMCI